VGLDVSPGLGPQAFLLPKEKKNHVTIECV
jgi:hypothetical protein